MQQGESRVSALPFKNAEAATTIQKGHAFKLGTSYGQAGNEALLNVLATTNPHGIALEAAVAGAMFSGECGAGAIVPVKLGGTVTRGAYLVSDTDGDLIASTTAGNRCFVIALEAGADGDTVEGLTIGFTVLP